MTSSPKSGDNVAAFATVSSFLSRFSVKTLSGSSRTIPSKSVSGKTKPSLYVSISKKSNATVADALQFKNGSCSLFSSIFMEISETDLIKISAISLIAVIIFEISIEFMIIANNLIGSSSSWLILYFKMLKSCSAVSCIIVILFMDMIFSINGMNSHWSSSVPIDKTSLMIMKIWQKLRSIESS